jgi:hypothetical protein
MKTTILILSLALFSCKKNYTCECNVVKQTTASYATFPESRYTTVTNIDKSSKSIANQLCKDKVTTTNYQNSNGVNQTSVETADCELK